MDRSQILQKLVEERQSLWRKIAYKIVGVDEIADDVLQESWRKLLASKVNFNSYEEWERYFKKIVIHTALDFRKMEGRMLKKSAPLEAALDQPDQQDGQLDRVIQGERRQSEEKMLNDVISILETLPAGQRDAVRWLILEEESKTLEQISRREGVPISTLRSRLAGAIKKIQKNLRKKEAL